MSLLHLAGSSNGTGLETLYPEDVFSTYLYTGTGSTQTINNGIDLAGKGGLVWLKPRTTYPSSNSHSWFDTVRGAYNQIFSNLTNAQVNFSDGVNSFGSTGFGVTAATGNGSGVSYASWTFRKAPKFFDIQTKVHTNGTASTIDLSVLGEVGMVVVKATSTTSNWYTWHRSLTTSNNLNLNLTDAQSTTNAYLSVSGTTLTIASTAPSATYVTYAWAHDPSADGIIQCGSFTTDSSGNATVNLGWEPQFSITKVSSTADHWHMLDVMRTYPSSVNNRLYPNLSNAESGTSTTTIEYTSTGFNSKGGLASQTYIYMAIRRPNKVPTSGTQVYNAVARTGTGAAATITGAGFTPDLLLSAGRNTAGVGMGTFYDRLRGTPLLDSSSTSVETTTSTPPKFDTMDGYTVTGSQNYLNGTTVNYINHFFKRAKGFFDVVCYTGSAVLSRPHSLGVVPELMIQKKRNNTSEWQVVYGPNTASSLIQLNSTSAGASFGNISTWHTSSTFYTIWSADSVVAYLFATLAGVSKVGSYIGNGSSQTINCGFSAGARFILIKRTDSTGDWYLWDNVRGIIAANDPHLSLNTTAAEVTTDDSIDPEASGFIVNQNTATNINVLNGTYIFLAIA